MLVSPTGDTHVNTASNASDSYPAGGWPDLPIEFWQATCRTLHMWTQVVGKVRLELLPHVNHWWQVPLYVPARALTTSAIHYSVSDFGIEFNFVEQSLP